MKKEIKKTPILIQGIVYNIELAMNFNNTL